MSKKEYPSLKKMNEQEGATTRSEWARKKERERPKFTKTETMEEFLARGGSVKKGETPKYEQAKDSRFHFNDKGAAARGVTRILHNKMGKLGGKNFNKGMSKSKIIEANLEKRVKRKKETAD